MTHPNDPHDPDQTNKLRAMGGQPPPPPRNAHAPRALPDLIEELDSDELEDLQEKTLRLDRAEIFGSPTGRFEIAPGPRPAAGMPASGPGSHRQPSLLPPPPANLAATPMPPGLGFTPPPPSYSTRAPVSTQHGWAPVSSGPDPKFGSIAPVAYDPRSVPPQALQTSRMAAQQAAPAKSSSSALLLGAAVFFGILALGGGAAGFAIASGALPLGPKTPVLTLAEPAPLPHVVVQPASAEPATASVNALPSAPAPIVANTAGARPSTTAATAPAASATPAASASARKEAPLATPAAPSAAAPPPAAPAAAPTSTTGTVKVGKDRLNIVVDREYRRVRDGFVSVPCGKHRVRVGLGSEQDVNVPCGGTLALE